MTTNPIEDLRLDTFVGRLKTALLLKRLPVPPEPWRYEWCFVDMCGPLKTITISEDHQLVCPEFVWQTEALTLRKRIRILSGTFSSRPLSEEDGERRKRGTIVNHMNHTVERSRDSRTGLWSSGRRNVRMVDEVVER